MAFPLVGLSDNIFLVQLIALFHSSAVLPLTVCAMLAAAEAACLARRSQSTAGRLWLRRVASPPLLLRRERRRGGCRACGSHRDGRLPTAASPHTRLPPRLTR